MYEGCTHSRGLLTVYLLGKDTVCKFIPVADGFAGIAFALWESASKKKKSDWAYDLLAYDEDCQ